MVYEYGYLIAASGKESLETSVRRSVEGNTLWLEQEDDLIELDRQQLIQLKGAIEMFLEGA